MHKWITYHMLCVVLDATRSNPLLYAVTDSNIAAAGRATLQTEREDDRSESSGKHNIEMPERRLVRRGRIHRSTTENFCLDEIRPRDWLI